MEVMSSCYRALVPYIYFNLNKRVEVPYEICLFLSFFFPSFFWMKFFYFLQNIIKNAPHQIIILITLAGKAMIQIKFKMKTCLMN